MRRRHRLPRAAPRAVAPGDRLGLFGFGASALCAIQVARHWGCEVYVCTRSPDEQRAGARARRGLGGRLRRGLPGPARRGGHLRAGRLGRHPRTGRLDRGATVAVNAIHLDEIPAFDYADLWWERSIASVANVTRADAREFLELAEQIPIATSVDVFALEDANAALAALEAGRVARRGGAGDRRMMRSSTCPHRASAAPDRR